MNNRSLTVAVSAAAFLLSGCQTYRSISAYIRSDNALTCPTSGILVGTETLPAFDPAKGADPSNIVYTARMTAIAARCDYSKRSQEADTRLVVKVHATRPPGGKAESFRVPYFVVVSSGSDVLDKKMHWLDLRFDGGKAVADEELIVDSVVVQVDRGKHAYDYHVLVGFQLTQAQIDYNTRMGQYAP